MSETIDRDLRLVLTAALAWLIEHDHPTFAHAEALDATIDRAALAAAIDKLGGTDV